MQDKKKVLIVEDDPYQQQLYSQWLPAGINTYMAATVSKAAAMLSALEPDMVILDIIMPDGSSLDLLPELQVGPLKSTKVFVISAALDEMDDQYKSELKARGVHGVFAKPVSMDQFHSLLEQ